MEVSVPPCDPCLNKRLNDHHQPSANNAASKCNPSYPPSNPHAAIFQRLDAFAVVTQLRYDNLVKPLIKSGQLCFNACQPFLWRHHRHG